MVKYCCHTVLDRIDVSCIGRKLRLLQSQMTVNVPPHAIQNIQKSLWVVSIHAQSSGKCTVDMFMRIDKCRHDDPAMCIDKFCIRICFLYFISYPHHLYGVTIHCNCTILKQYTGCVPCDHSSVSNNQHKDLLLVL